MRPRVPPTEAGAGDGGPRVVVKTCTRAPTAPLGSRTGAPPSTASRSRAPSFSGALPLESLSMSPDAWESPLAPLAPERAPQHSQPVRHPVLVYCGRCEQHHAAFAAEREDDTEWLVEHGPCRASVCAPLIGAAASDPLVLDGVRRRLEQALAPRRSGARADPVRADEGDVELDAWSARRA